MPLTLRVAALVVTSALALTGCSSDTYTDADFGDAPRCDEVDRWLTASANAEDELIDAIDALRESGAECEGGTVAGAGPLETDPALHCAARLHAGDLIRNPSVEVGHEGSDGSSALSRANAAGYDGIARQELLAGDFVDVDALVDAWISSDRHCQALLDDTLDHIGVAQATTIKGDRIVWVVVTGQERQ